jgi:hypothetical protein
MVRYSIRYYNYFKLFKIRIKLLYNLIIDKFDQFWSINKKLMEVTDGECFKSIPFRIYQVIALFDYKYLV